MLKSNIKQVIRNRQNLKIMLKDSLFPIAILKENQKYYNLHKGERCFILGSGPSIVKQDLKKLGGELVITQNHFQVHEDIKIIHPAYHCVVPFFHSEDFISDWIDWFRSMEARLPLDTQMFFHLNTKRILEENNFFTDRVNYLKVGLNSMTLERARVDITKRIIEVPTALTQCVTIALYMGFEKIYLLGCDMDQIGSLIAGEKQRFYGDSQITNNEYELKNDERQLATGYIWYHYWLMWKQFILFRKYAEINNSEIINLTEGGILNCYKRQAYNEVVP